MYPSPQSKLSAQEQKTVACRTVQLLRLGIH